MMRCPFVNIRSNLFFSFRRTAIRSLVWPLDDDDIIILMIVMIMMMVMFLRGWTLIYFQQNHVYNTLYKT